jgi:hypothetical protein
MASPKIKVLLLIATALLSGCSHLLPGVKREVSNPWADFAAVKQSFDEIVPHQTSMEGVRTLGFNPDATPNMEILNQAQVVEAALPSPLQDRSTISRGIVDCMDAGSRCVGYALQPSRIQTQRVGYFLLDILNFRRDTVTTGWKFSALIVVIDNQVVYKQWSGQPQIRSTVRSTNPLGPLQKIDEAMGLGP